MQFFCLDKGENCHLSGLKIEILFLSIVLVVVNLAVREADSLELMFVVNGDSSAAIQPFKCIACQRCC